MKTGTAIVMFSIWCTGICSCRPRIDIGARQYQRAPSFNHCSYSFANFTGSDNFSFTPAKENGWIIIRTQIEGGQIRFTYHQQELIIETPDSRVDSVPIQSIGKDNTLVMEGKKSSGKVEIAYVDR